MRVRAFERENAACRKCGWVGGTDDGLCILCSNLAPDPYASATPVGDVPPLVAHACVYCGAEHEGIGELCRRCHAEMSAVTEPGWRDRYAS